MLINKSMAPFEIDVNDEAEPSTSPQNERPQSPIRLTPRMPVHHVREIRPQVITNQPNDFNQRFRNVPIVRIRPLVRNTPDPPEPEPQLPAQQVRLEGGELSDMYFEDILPGDEVDYDGAQNIVVARQYLRIMIRGQDQSIRYAYRAVGGARFTRGYIENDMMILDRPEENNDLFEENERPSRPVIPLPQIVSVRHEPFMPGQEQDDDVIIIDDDDDDDNDDNDNDDNDNDDNDNDEPLNGEVEQEPPQQQQLQHQQRNENADVDQQQLQLQDKIRFRLQLDEDDEENVDDEEDVDDDDVEEDTEREDPEEYDDEGPDGGEYEDDPEGGEYEGEDDNEDYAEGDNDDNDDQNHDFDDDDDETDENLEVQQQGENRATQPQSDDRSINQPEVPNDLPGLLPIIKLEYSEDIPELLEPSIDFPILLPVKIEKFEVKPEPESSIDFPIPLSEIKIENSEVIPEPEPSIDLPIFLPVKIENSEVKPEPEPFNDHPIILSIKLEDSKVIPEPEPSRDLSTNNKATQPQSDDRSIDQPKSSKDCSRYLTSKRKNFQAIHGTGSSRDLSTDNDYPSQKKVKVSIPRSSSPHKGDNQISKRPCLQTQPSTSLTFSTPTEVLPIKKKKMKKPKSHDGARPSGGSTKLRGFKKAAGPKRGFSERRRSGGPKRGSTKQRQSAGLKHRLTKLRQF